MVRTGVVAMARGAQALDTSLNAGSSIAVDLKEIIIIHCEGARNGQNSFWRY